MNEQRARFMREFAEVSRELSDHDINVVSTGEPRYWLAYVYIDGRRHAFGTSELRHLTLDEQLPELRKQLKTFATDNAAWN
jgi:hypothetical protein